VNSIPVDSSGPAPLLRERVGEVVGRLGAPLFAIAASARHGRALHPDGLVLHATVDAEETGDPRLRAVGERLSGPALVRLSAALWKRGPERIDVLGCAVRFRSTDEDSVDPRSGDQDLLFATVRSPMTMAVAPLRTNAHDFLGNTYFATAPFDVSGVGRCKWRLVPEGASEPGANRRERLLRAIAAGAASLSLQLRPTWTPSYAPVARLRLRSVMEVDQQALQFDPFRTGRGIVPRGFVHALRRGADAGSQVARPGHQGGVRG